MYPEPDAIIPFSVPKPTWSGASPSPFLESVNIKPSSTLLK